MRRALLALALLGVTLSAETTRAQEPETPDVETVVRADFPTNMAFAPDGRLFFTEKDTGRVRIVKDGRLVPEPFVTVPSQSISLESGLLGVALHPRFPKEPWMYLYYSGGERNVLARVRAEGDRGTATEILVELLPVSSFHLGGDMTFGADGRLYLVIGEATQADLAQDRQSVGGKVLRLAPDGSTPADNPFGAQSPVYSLGHRNSFGLCVDPETGNLWETENGASDHDEVNLLRPGANYGWPEVAGDAEDARFVDPVLDIEETIVPTGCAFYTGPHLGPRSEGSLFFGDFNGTLHRAVLSPDRRSVATEEPFLEGLPGITDVLMGPDGRLYVATPKSILRLPVEVAAPSPRRSPSPSQTRSPLATVDLEPEEEASPLPWIVAGAVLVGLGTGLALALRRRR